LIKTISAVLLGLMLLAPRSAKADDEASALATFNRSVATADPHQVQAAFEQGHTNPPSKEEMEKLMKTMVDAAMEVMDQASQFEKQFPQSKQLVQVHESMVDTLTRDFGSMGFPVPKNRAGDLETFARNSLKETPGDAQLYMILVRVAQASPVAKAHDLFVELGTDSTPQPARTMARQGLVTLERIGVPLDINFTALDGRQFNLADLRGKVVLVDFWSTTCVPCVAELPGLKQLYEKYHTNGFEIVGISLDSDKAALTRFIAKEKISWPQFYDPAGETNRLAMQYGVRAIPVVWLVDKHGALRQTDARWDEEKKVEALLKE
jgi:peroxiredoxin